MRFTLIGLAVWLLVSWTVARQLIRRPRRWFAEPPPSVAWGEFEPHQIVTGDGHRLGAWLVRGRDEGPSVVLLHGNKGSRRNCLDRAQIYAQQGCSVLLVSLRAHGDSTGEVNDIGFSARHDVIAAVAFLEARRPGRPVLIHGVSMGAAAAVFAAQGLADRVRGYILECPYQDLRTAVWNRVENALPRGVEWVAYEGLLAVSPLVLPDLDKISPLAAIGEIPTDVPILILAGGRDQRARPAESRALFQRVRTHATLTVFDEADHVQLHAVDPPRYRRVLTDFLGLAAAHP